VVHTRQACEPGLGVAGSHQIKEATHLSSHEPCVWLGVGWVGLDPTQFWGTEPTKRVFGCTSILGTDPTHFSVWLKY